MVRVFDLNAQTAPALEAELKLGTGALRLQLSGDGRHLLVRDTAARLYALPSAVPIREWPNVNVASDIHMARDAQRVAIAECTFSCTLRVEDFAGTELPAPATSARTVRLSPNGTRLAIGSESSSTTYENGKFLGGAARGVRD